MHKNTFNQFSHVPYFTINGYRQIANPINTRTYLARVELNRAVEKGSIVRLKNGVYTTRNFFLDHHNDPEFINAISSVIFPKSYISLESTLQRAGILTETTPITTAITTEGTRVIENSLGTFSYRHVKAKLYHSYEIHSYFGIEYAEATLSKALFDFFYLKPLAKIIRSKDYDLVEDLRLNLDDFPREYRKHFQELCIQSGIVKMKKISDFLSREIW